LLSLILRSPLKAGVSKDEALAQIRFRATIPDNLDLRIDQVTGNDVT
jgi:hypothetical protein